MLNNVPEHIQNRLKTFYKICQRGAENSSTGEVQNAAAFMTKMMAKYDLVLSDFYDEETSRVEFKYSNGPEKKILWQTIFKILKATKNVTYRQGRMYISLELTKLQAAEISMAYDIYRKDFKIYMKDQTDLLVSAYINANNIYAVSTDEEVTVTPEEMTRIRKIWALSEGVEPVAIHKMISE